MIGVVVRGGSTVNPAIRAPAAAMAILSATSLLAPYLSLIHPTGSVNSTDARLGMALINPISMLLNTNSFRSSTIMVLLMLPAAWINA